MYVLIKKTCLPVCVENLTCCLVFHALHATREKSATLQIGIYDDCPRDLVAWIKVVRCPGLVNLLGFLKMRNKNITFFLCRYGQSVCMSGFPVLLLLPAWQWHFTVMMFCKYSHFGLSIFQKVRGSWQISKRGKAVHTFYSLSWSFTEFDTVFQPSYAWCREGEKQQGTKMALRHLWSLCQATRGLLGLWAELGANAAARIRAGITRCLWPRHRWHRRLPRLLRPRTAEEEQTGARTSGPCCNVTFTFHPSISL